MKTHTTNRRYHVRTKSGLIGWRTRLRNNYNDLADFIQWSDVCALADRLGFKSAESAWKANPVIEGSTNPADFRKVSK